MSARLREDARSCLAAAIAAVDPARLVRRRLTTADGELVLLGADGAPLARHRGPVLLVGVGKAGLAMTSAAAAVVGARLECGIVIVPYGSPGGPRGGITVCPGAHPVPDAAGAAATRDVLAAVRGAGPETLVLLALSGGASALLVAPAEGVSLGDKRLLSERLLAAGADIRALNAVRKHCSQVKGGGLARAAAGSAGLWTLALSDVVDDDLATIGSGPGVADPTTFGDAVAALDRWLAPAERPPAIVEHLAEGQAGRRQETVKPADRGLAHTCATVVGGNRDAQAAAAREATRRGYVVRYLDAPIVGDARVVGERVTRLLLDTPGDQPVALIAGGETTVRAVPGGVGGRSQHLALAAALELAGLHACLLAAGTDGVDGPTSAAGGCVDGTTADRARALGLDLRDALARTDSHRALAALDDLVVTGPTGTNVADVVVGLRAAW